MQQLPRLTVYAFYLILWTYVIPDLRLESLGKVPYCVPVAGLALVLAILTDGRRLLSVRLPPALVLFTTGQIVSVLATLMFSDQPKIDLIIRTLGFSLLPLAFTMILRTAEHIKHAVLCLLVSASVAFGYGAYGYATGSVGDPLEHAFHYFGISYTMATKNTDMYYVLSGLTIAVAYTVANWKPAGLAVRTVLITGIGITIVGLALSLARGAWITAAAMIAFMMIWGHGRRLKVGIQFLSRAAIVVCVLVVFALGITALISNEDLQRVVDRSSSIFTTTNEYGSNSNLNRIELIRVTLQTALRNPIMGVGIGNLRVEYRSAYGIPLNHAENAYVNVLGEQGVLGLISLLTLIVWLARALWLVRADRPGHPVSWLKGALMGEVVVFVLYAGFNLLIDSLWCWGVLSLCSAGAACYTRESIAVLPALTRRVILKDRELV